MEGFLTSWLSCQRKINIAWIRVPRVRGTLRRIRRFCRCQARDGLSSQGLDSSQTRDPPPKGGLLSDLQNGRKQLWQGNGRVTPKCEVPLLQPLQLPRRLGVHVHINIHGPHIPCQPKKPLRGTHSLGRPNGQHYVHAAIHPVLYPLHRLILHTLAEPHDVGALKTAATGGTLGDFRAGDVRCWCGGVQERQGVGGICRCRGGRQGGEEGVRGVVLCPPSAAAVRALQAEEAAVDLVELVAAVAGALEEV